MAEQLWPLILVGLLASLVTSSVPWLTTLDPNRPEGMLVQVLQTLGAAHDLDAHIVLTGPEGPAVAFQLQWLRGEEEALRITFLAPKELRGEMFTLRNGLLAHWRPDPQGGGGVIVRLTLPQEAPEAGSPFAWGNFDPRELITGIRLGTVRVTARRERLGEGWGQLLKKVQEYSLPMTLTSHGDPFGSGLLFAPLTSLRPKPDSKLTLPGFGMPRPSPPTLRGPIRLQVSGRLASAPAFRRVVLWLDEGERVPHRVRLYLGGKDGDLVLSISLLSLKTNVGLTLREVLALPPARKTIWE